MNRKLHEGNIAEIKELFGGTYKDIRELAKIFHISQPYLCWIVDYNGKKEKNKQADLRWRQKNLDSINAKHREYYQKNREDLCRKASIRRKKAYWLDPDKYRAISRENYRKKLIINKNYGKETGNTRPQGSGPQGNLRP